MNTFERFGERRVQDEKLAEELAYAEAPWRNRAMEAEQKGREVTKELCLKAANLAAEQEEAVLALVGKDAETGRGAAQQVSIHRFQTLPYGAIGTFVREGK
jgi:hypothetical protein